MENIIKKAHAAITRIKGKEYAPTSTEIQDYIDKQITMAQQTALQFFLMGLIDLEIGKGIPTNKQFELHNLFEQAEAMHKEEIEEAYGHGQNNGYMYANQRAITISKENYFKQTFGGDNETH